MPRTGPGPPDDPCWNRDCEFVIEMGLPRFERGRQPGPSGTGIRRYGSRRQNATTPVIVKDRGGRLCH